MHRDLAARGRASRRGAGRACRACSPAGARSRRSSPPSTASKRVAPAARRCSRRACRRARPLLLELLHGARAIALDGLAAPSARRRGTRRLFDDQLRLAADGHDRAAAVVVGDDVADLALGGRAARALAGTRHPLLPQQHPRGLDVAARSPRARACSPSSPRPSRSRSSLTSAAEISVIRPPPRRRPPPRSARDLGAGCGSGCGSASAAARLGLGGSSASSAGGAAVLRPPPPEPARRPPCRSRRRPGALELRGGDRGSPSPCRRRSRRRSRG